MIDVLLVDDEDMIREGIADSVDWARLNMHIVGQAEDGKDGLELFTQHRPQLILTDIKMPFMDGLELVERVKSLAPDTYIIIISGYDEFEYAQKAVKLGAHDFILKPIDLEDLEQILFKISMDYEDKKKRQTEEQVLKEKVDNSLSILREGFLKELLFRNIEADSIAGRIVDLEIKDCNYGTVLVLQMDNQVNLNRESGFSSIKELLKDKDGIFVVEMNKDELIIIILGATEGIIRSKMNKLFNSVRAEQPSLTIAYGNISASLPSLAQSYREALEALEHKFILGSGQNISYESIKGRVREYSGFINNKDHDIIYSLDFTDKDTIRKDVTELMDNIKAAGRDSYLYSQMIISNIYMAAIKALREFGGSVEEVFDQPIEEFKQLAAKPTVEMVKDELLVTLFRIADYINERKFGRYSYIIEKAKHYINQHHHNPNLSVDLVARYVNISNSYFSILFKQETGQTFVDYLTSVRIEKAKGLLKVSGYRSYEISDQVGFNNSTYFSTIFKRYTGCSPSEYRKRELKSE